jgi:surface antigen
MTKKVKAKILFLFFISFILTNCTTTNHTKTDKKILDYESSGSVFNALSLGVPGAAILFLAVDINNYKKFNLNEKEIKMHTDSIQIALNNTPNGKIVSWHNGDRLSSGKVRVVKTYHKNDRYCRIFQSYIKLNGVEKHTTKHVCRIKNIWQF